MLNPEIIDYLLTLRYPGSPLERGNWVCYQGGYQLLVPAVAAGEELNLTVRPLLGVYAWLAYSLMFAHDAISRTFTGSISQYGTTSYRGLGTGRILEEGWHVLQFITEQEPTLLAVRNISPVTQRWEAIGQFLVIPTPQDMETVVDSLRRMNTSSETERLLGDAVRLLESLPSPTGIEPKPPLGGVK